MFKHLYELFGSIFGVKNQQNHLVSAKAKVAIAELLYHVTLSDNKITDDERQSIYSIAQDKLGVPITFLESYLTEMNNGEDKDINLVQIGHILNEDLDQEERQSLVRTLTALTYSDNQLDGAEDLRVWEIAQLLDVETLRPLTD